GNLNFGNSANPQAIDIGNSNSGGGVLNFQVSAGNGTITSGGVAGATNTISAPLQLNGPTAGLTVTVPAASTNSLTLGGTIQVNGNNGTIQNSMTAAGKQVVINGNMLLYDATTPLTARSLIVRSDNDTTTVINGTFVRGDGVTASNTGTVALNIAGVNQPRGKFILNAP